MDDRSLKIINIMTVLAILLIGTLSWIYMREQFMWGMVLIALILVLVGYMNLHKIIADAH